MHREGDRVYLSYKIVTLWLLALIAAKSIIAQTPTFNHLTVENGLSHNAVLSITQDSRGFLWFGTQIGLNRYDGHQFKIYKSSRADSTSISDNNIVALLADSKHTLWIGTSNGLNRYDTLTDSFERIALTSIGAPAQSGNILCLYKDREENLWVGTVNGLVKLNGNDRSSLLPGKTIRCIYEDHNGDMWLGTNDGLLKMSQTNDQHRFEMFHSNPGDPKSISASYVTSIMEDVHHNLWIGTQNGGVNLYDPSTNTFTHFLHDNNQPSGIINNNIRKIISDKTGLLWIGTQEGLSTLDPVTKKIQSYRHDAGNKKSLSQNSIYSLFEDASGSLWAGTYFGGINAIFPYTTSFNILQNNENISSLSNNVISSVVEDEKHNLWIGTEGGGLNYFNRSNGRFTAFTSKTSDHSGIGSNLIKSVYGDKSGNIWVGTHGGGLNLFNPESQTFTRLLFRGNDAETLNSEVLALLDDSQGRFWVGTNSGLKLFRRNHTELDPFENSALVKRASNKFARSLFEDSRKQIWIGGINGLYIVRDDTIAQISQDYTNCVTEDSHGNIWVGLYYGGLAMYDAINKRLNYYTEKEGLPNNNVIGILEDHQKNLWLSTDNGLIKFNITSKSFHTYTVSDGLADNAFNYHSYLKDSKGELFFGGYNGLTSFFPDSIEINNFTAPVVFTGLKLFNEPVSINGDDHLLKHDIGSTQQLTFKYNQDVFSIEFALLNFIKSGKNRYAYMLEGFDKDWNDINTTSVTYTNLPSGDYTFLVKGANNDGIWSEPAVLKIKVLPPFWLTWWAYCLYALVVLLIFFLVTRFFFLQALFKKEDELHQVKLNFFTNVSHEIRTHLTLIMVPLEKMMDEKEISDFSRRQLINIKSNADRLLKLVSELMDFRKADSNHLQLQIGRYDLILFLQEIYSGFKEVSLAKNITTSFQTNIKSLPIYFDKEQLSKVFFNLLSNAFKFTPKGGHVMMNITSNDKLVKICIEDNGRGIAPAHLEKLFTNFFQVADYGIQNTGYGIGLALSKNIVELHKGSIAVESQSATKDKASRTSFTVSLLTGNSHFENVHYLQETTVEEPEKVNTQHQPEVHADKDLSPVNSKKVFNILVVEDNIELRSLISESFKKNYKIIECEDGGEGWQIAIEQLPDLIISDIMMPVMDGLALCTKLKTDERTSHIPVILLTAKSSQNDFVSGLETGADAYISKPFNTKILELNVRNLLASRERLRQKFSLQISREPSSLKTDDVKSDIKETVINNVDGEFINNVIQLVEMHMDDPEFGVEMLAKKVAMSQPILYKKLKAVTNMSVNDFVKTLRLKRAAHLLKQQQFTVYEVAYAVGYNDRKYFSKEFKKQFGKTPSEYAGMDE